MENKIFDNLKYCDCELTFFCYGEKIIINAHKYTLSLKSKFFDTLFSFKNTNRYEVTLDFSKKNIVELFRYIYDNKYINIDYNVKDLISLINLVDYLIIEQKIIKRIFNNIRSKDELELIANKEEINIKPLRNYLDLLDKVTKNEIFNSGGLVYLNLDNSAICFDYNGNSYFDFWLEYFACRECCASNKNFRICGEFYHSEENYKIPNCKIFYTNGINEYEREITFIKKKKNDYYNFELDTEISTKDFFVTEIKLYNDLSITCCL